MPNRPISQDTALTSPASGDLIPVVDVSEAAAADKNKSVTFSVLETYFNSVLNFAAVSHAHNWSDITTGLPTTLSGYGISDTKANFDLALSDGAFMYIGDPPTSHSHIEADITDLGDYIPAVPTATVGNFAAFNASGDVYDSTYTNTSFDAAGTATSAVSSHESTYNHADYETHIALTNEHIDWTSATQNLSTSGTLSGSNLSGTNTGDQDLSDYIKQTPASGVSQSITAAASTDTPLTLNAHASQVSDIFKVFAKNGTSYCSIEDDGTFRIYGGGSNGSVHYPNGASGWVNIDEGSVDLANSGAVGAFYIFDPTNKGIYVDGHASQSAALVDIDGKMIVDAAGNISATNLSGTNTGDEVSATDTVEGIVELATQAEVDAGTDTSRVVTPATLANYSGLGGSNYWTQNGTDLYYTTGNVGIGTTSPALKLDVKTGTSGTEDAIRITGPNRTWSGVGTCKTGILGVPANGTLNSHDLGLLSFEQAPQGNQGGGSAFALYAGGASSSRNSGALQYRCGFLDDANNIGHIWYRNGSEKMRIHNDGSVGIGVTTPEHLLDVAGAVKQQGLTQDYGYRCHLLRDIALWSTSNGSQAGTLAIKLGSTASNTFFNGKVVISQNYNSPIEVIFNCYAQPTTILNADVVVNDDGADIVSVRFAINSSDGLPYLLIANNATPTSSSWLSYPKVHLEWLVTGWTGADEAGNDEPGAYTVSFLTSETGYTVYQTPTIKRGRGLWQTHTDGSPYVTGDAWASSFRAAASPGSANNLRLHHNNSNAYLDYNGGAFYLRNNGSTNVLIVDDSNNVGIGTTSSGTRLEVAGSVTVSGSSSIFRSIANTDQRIKYSLWSNDVWGFGMEASVTYGGLNSYAVMSVTNAAAGATAGFWWGTDTQSKATGAMALTADGKLTVAGGMRVGYGDDDTTAPTIGRVEVGGNLFAEGVRSTGEIISTYNNAVRMVQGNYGIFWRNDGNDFWLLRTASGDQYGSYDTYRPFNWDMATGAVSLGYAASSNKLVTSSTGITVNGNIVVTGTVDGRDVAADGTKLDGIEAGANNYTLPSGIYNTALRVGYSTTVYWDYNSTTTNVYFGSVEDFRFSDGGAFLANGNVTAYSGTIASDLKLKKNLRPIDNALEKLSTLTGYEYQMKRDGSNSAGLIAQEVEKILPCAVEMTEGLGDNEDHLSLNYNSVIALLVQAVNDLTARVRELERDHI